MIDSGAAPGKPRRSSGSAKGERVSSQVRISDTSGNFGGGLSDYDRLGFSAAPLGDLDGDGIGDVAVGAALDDDGGTDCGEMWVLFLNNDGAVKSHRKISAAAGGFTGHLDPDDRFGGGADAPGDLDEDGITDLVIGTTRDDDGGTDRGALWILLLDADGSVKRTKKVSSTQGGFSGPLNDGDLFGFDLVSLGDHNGDGVLDWVVGAHLDDDEGPVRRPAVGVGGQHQQCVPASQP